MAHDFALEHPRSVFQLLKKHYSRYTPEIVERITGIPKDQFLKAADLFTSVRKDGDIKKVGTILYAVGWTQHSSGTQTIRTVAMLQLLLGNVGRAGGGRSSGTRTNWLPPCACRSFIKESFKPVEIHRQKTVMDVPFWGVGAILNLRN